MDEVADLLSAWGIPELIPNFASKYLPMIRVSLRFKFVNLAD